ncbi:SCO2583/SCO2584 N-terminal domain-containing protein [Kitasatospora azatica]|uniref:SCO2583/SCO2584 N-terminal domain-containing protein n=1 Tax=Kitasatospora azatica TaxID=58347 RepID=UPI000563A65C|nr:hypothetical protein [Kitasatospora azatica]
MPIAEDPEPRPSGEEPDPFADLVLDEEFVRSASVKEPSSRARMLAAKWQREPPTDTEFRPPTEIRRRRFGRRAKRVDPWGNKRKRTRNWQAPVFVLLTVAVVAAALNVNGLHGWYLDHFGSKDDGGTSVAAPASPKPVATQAPETAKPTAAPSTQAPQTPTVAHPWAGSPAETWPTGADAIVLPDAQATGVFGKDEVQADLELVKKYLATANLDQGVVAAGATQPVLDLLDRQEREDLTAALTHPDKDHDPTSWMSRFNARTAVPAVPEIKLQGRITFEGDGKEGLLVHTDYSFVYALVPGPERYHPSAQGGVSGQSVSLHQLAPTAEVTREIVRRIQDFRFYDPAHYKVDPNKIILDKGAYDMAGNYCEVGDGWLQPSFPEPGLPGDPSASGPTTDPYDRSKELKNDGKCGTVSRT